MAIVSTSNNFSIYLNDISSILSEDIYDALTRCKYISSDIFHNLESPLLGLSRCKIQEIINKIANIRQVVEIKLTLLRSIFHRVRLELQSIISNNYRERSKCTDLSDYKKVIDNISDILSAFIPLAEIKTKTSIRFVNSKPSEDKQYLIDLSNRINGMTQKREIKDIKETVKMYYNKVLRLIDIVEYCIINIRKFIREPSDHSLSKNYYWMVPAAIVIFALIKWY